MSFKSNVVSNYIAKIFITVVSIISVPIYIKYMGTEAFGLVGFYAMLQAFFMLLDMGLTPTMAREAAKCNGGVTDELDLRRLLRSMEGVFIVFALIGALALIAFSGSISSGWLNVQRLSSGEVQHSIMLIAVIVAIRWISGVYRGVINGFEHLIWLNAFSCSIATARYLFVIPILIYLCNRPTCFFVFQLMVAVLEIIIIASKAYSLIPKIDRMKAIPWQWQPLRSMIGFSLTIAFTSSVWVVVTQTDKLILSKMLTLSDYAYFSVAVLLANGITIIGSTISSALLPRLTKLDAQNEEAEVIGLYRKATQLVTVITIPVVLILWVYSKQILWVWTGDMGLAIKASPVLSLYALGNGLLALASFPYYLQYAKGDLRFHIFGSIIFTAFLIPAMILLTDKYGLIGAGYAWLGVNSIYFILWVPIVHFRFFRTLHKTWLINDILSIIAASGLVLFAVQHWVSLPNNRILIAIILAVISLMLILVSGIVTPFMRQAVARKIRESI